MAERERVVAPKSSSRPGHWRNNVTPYLVDIMDCYNDPFVEVIVVMKAARMGVTEVINNIHLYTVKIDPCSNLYVQQTIQEGQKYSKKIYQPLVDYTPAMKAAVYESKAHDKNNTILEKSWPGGALTITGANTATGFRMIFVKNVYLDDVDGFEADVSGEGDPVSLAMMRCETHPDKKIYVVSSPTIKGFSRIEAIFNLSDKRHYYIPCAFCGELQFLKFKQLKWPNRRPDQAIYECEICAAGIKNYQKQEMLINGKWRAHSEFTNTAGFFLPIFYSPFVTWPRVVEKWLKAKDDGREALKVFVNTFLAETFDEEGGEGVNYHELFNRRENYGPKVPKQAAVLTFGADIQGGKNGRIECEVVAWGIGRESWSMEQVVFHGDPTIPGGVWDDFDSFLQKIYEHECGAKLNIISGFIDSGFATQQVYEFCKTRTHRRIYASKGSSQPSKPLVGRPTIHKLAKIRLFPIGTDTAKDLVYGWLKQKKPEQSTEETPIPGYCHFPIQYDNEYFEQLTAEKVVTKYSKGHPIRQWVLPAGKKNEVLDCRILALASLIALNPNLERLVQNLATHKANTGAPGAEATPRRWTISKGFSSSYRPYSGRWR